MICNHSGESTTLLVANAGSASDLGGAAELSRALTGPVQTHVLGAEDDLPACIREAGERIARIVLCGGDGTINWALDALLDAKRPIGLIPAGTANDLARSLGIPPDPRQAVEIINRGHRRRIDVARANDVSFVNALGIGLGPLTTRAMEGKEKATFGVGAYLLGLIRALRRIPRFSARVESGDRQCEGRFIQITVANGIHYGGGMTVSEHAQLDDGRLDVLLVRARSRWQLLANALRFKTGFTENSEVLEHWQCRTLKITTAHPLDITADGEFLTRTPVACDVLPEALTFFAPPTAG